MQSLKSMVEFFSPYIDKKQCIIKRNCLHVMPKNVKEVQKILQASSKNKIKFIVQSQGKDWGYSSIKKGDIILDLCKMDKIIEFNEKLAYIRIEPGVTFQQTHDFLKKNKSNLMLTTSSGPPDGSIIATTLMRGIGKGIQGDLFNYCCNLEGVLQSGEIIHTGFGNNQNAVAQNVHRWGNGPSIDGLFSQSNIAVITKMTVWLVPKPKFYSVYSFRLKSDVQLNQFIPVIRYLKMNRIIEGNFLLANQYRILALKCQYPWEITTKTPLDIKIMNKIMIQIGMPEKWVATSIIYEENEELVKAKQKTITTYLKPFVNNLQFITSEDTLKSKKTNKAFGDIENTPFFGVPTDNALKLLYWRKKTSVPKDIDPIRDNCGIYWVNGVLPLDEKIIQKALKISEKIYKKYKFEPNIGLNVISERSVYLIGMIVFDKDVLEEEAQARDCYNNLTTEFSKMGMYPFKLSSKEREEKTISTLSTLNTILQFSDLKG